MSQTKFNIFSENFDLFFAQQVAGASRQAIAQVPHDVAFRVFRGRDKDILREKRLTKIPFLEKLWVLWKCLNKRVWVVVEDEQTGLSIEDFQKLHTAVKARDRVKEAEGMKIPATFITASKELGDSFAYLHSICDSPAYNFVNRGKHKIPNDVAKWKGNMLNVCKFLAFYESKKRTWMDQGICNIPEWYILLSLYHGEEMACAVLHKEIFKNAPLSSVHRMKLAYGSLQNKGYIQKISSDKWTKFKITATGTEAVNTILSKYALSA